MPYPVSAVRNKNFGVSLGIPQTVSGLHLWLAADTGVFTDNGATTPATADGDHIAVWQDQSGDGYDVSQSTDGSRPLLKLAANGINGRATILFDGTASILQRAVNDWRIADQSGTIFVVYRLTAPIQAGTAGLFSSALDSSGGRHITTRGSVTSGINNMELSQQNADTEDALSGSTAITAGTTYIGVWKSSGTAIALRLNNVAQTITVRNGANNGDWFADVSNRDKITVGALRSGVNFLKGSVSEILYYSQNVVGSDLTSIETYLNSKYAAW